MAVNFLSAPLILSAQHKFLFILQAVFLKFIWFPNIYFPVTGL